jgi:hypothetical protein
MKIRVVLLISLGLGIVSSLPGQTGPSVPASPVAPAPVAITPPPGQNADVRSQKNQGRGQRRIDAQQQPSASIAPSVNRQQKPRPHNPSRRPVINYSDAIKRQHHQRHDREWWKSRYPVIVFVTGQGYYYWDAGYWFPALGFDPRYDTYEYNGPIYTYGELLPDQVIYNVQRALKELGYYSGNLSGSMSSATINAIAAFQEDNGLDATGAIDAPTVEALGLD